MDKVVTILDASVSHHLDVFDQYAAWTDNVAQYPATAEPFYLALGIADEVGELEDAADDEARLKEAGDVLWYCARYATRVLKIAFSKVVEDAVGIKSPTLNFSKYTGIICGVEKKRIRDGESWTNAKRHTKEADAYIALLNIVARVRFTLYMDRKTLDDAVRENVRKLGARLESGTIKGDGDNR